MCPGCMSPGVYLSHIESPDTTLSRHRSLCLRHMAQDTPDIVIWSNACKEIQLLLLLIGSSLIMSAERSAVSKRSTTTVKSNSQGNAPSFASTV